MKRPFQSIIFDFDYTLAPRIIKKFQHKGFCFVPYEFDEIDILPFYFSRHKDFGMTWMSHTFVDETVKDIFDGSVAQLMYTPLGWDHHQDTYCYQRLPSDLHLSKKHGVME